MASIHRYFPPTATHLMRHYGREECQNDLNLWFFGDQPLTEEPDADERGGEAEGEEPQRGVVSRLVRHPVRILRYG